MKIEELQPNSAVLYVPGHARGDPKHPDCERGIVQSVSPTIAFVRYYGVDGTLKPARATRPESLLVWPDAPQPT